MPMVFGRAWDGVPAQPSADHAKGTAPVTTLCGLKVTRRTNVWSVERMVTCKRCRAKLEAR